MKTSTTPLDYLQKVRADGYATSLNYVQNVYNVVLKYNLTQYDNLNAAAAAHKQERSGTMGFSPYICMQTHSTCYTQTRKMKVKGILWHSTGANNPTLKRYVQPYEGEANYNEAIAKLGKNTSRNDWNHINHQAGLNAWIGKFADGSVGTVQTMPWDYRPWGCGSGSKGSCNNGWIQFEICEDGLNDRAYFEKVYNEAVQLTAFLCKKFNLDPMGTVNMGGVQVPVITCHNDAHKLGYGSGHADINHWFPKFGKNMATAREDVKKAMGAAAPVTPATTQAPKPATPAPAVSNNNFRVRVTATALNIRKGPGTNYAITGCIRDKGVYTIVETKNNWGRLFSGAGWISLAYTKRQ